MEVTAVTGVRRSARATDGSVLAALTALFSVVVAQAATAAVLPALSRSLGLADWQAGAVTSASAAVVVVSSAAWGRVADARGSRPVLVAGAAVALASVALVGGVAAGADVLPGGPAWAVLLVARGLLFGTAVAAVGPAVQARLVASAPGTAERVTWIARAGAVRGLGTIVGAGLAAGLGLLGIHAPLAAGALLIALALAAVARRGRAAHGQVAPAGVVPAVPATEPAPAALATDSHPAALATEPHAAAPAAEPAPTAPTTPGDHAPAPAAPAPPARPAPRRSDPALRTPAVRRALVRSCALFLALALVQGSAGFLVQDRYGLDHGRATALTGLLLLLAGAGSVLAQGVVVPRLGWSPERLVLRGGVVTLLAVAVYAVRTPVPVLAVVAFVFGLGVGCAAAGCTSLASLAVPGGAQGDAAGVVNAANALALVVGPLVATSTYGLHPALPGVLAVVAALVVVLVRAGGDR